MFEKMVAAAQIRLAGLDPFAISLGAAIIDPEVVRLVANPPELVGRLRQELRAAIGEVWGDDQVPEEAADFTPPRQPRLQQPRRRYEADP
jgi:hypothetical protein